MNAQLELLRSAFHEIEANGNAEGLRITVERAVSFSNPTIRFALRIERERTTASGRQGKPTPIVVIVNQPGETPTDMLHTLVDLVNQEAS